VAELLKELHVFPRANFHIADKMLADAKFRSLRGAALLSEVRSTFFRVFNQERASARNDDEAMRYTVNRLKAGDWGAGLETVLAEADRRKRDRYADLYASHAPPTPQPSTTAEAQAVWNAVLELLASEVTRANYETWLQDTVALGLSSTRLALIVQVADKDVVAALSNRLAPAIERALYQTLETQGADLGLEPERVRVHFVTAAMLREKPRQPWEESPYAYAEQVQPLWRDTLGEAKLQLTRATFDQWLRDTVALGINGDGQTLVVRVRNYQAVEWLTGKLYDVIHRSLMTNLTYGEGNEYGLEVSTDTLGVRFVTGEMLEDEGVDAA
jgi:hypothetical protein